MAKLLDYCRVEDPNDPRRSRGTTAAVVLGVLAGVCFLLPFGLFWVCAWVWPGDQGQVMVMMAIPAMLLWLAAGLLGLCGTVVGAWALYHDRPRVGTIVSASISGVIMLIAAVHVVRGIVQTWRQGR
jgi:hypothetical protein